MSYSDAEIARLALATLDLTDLNEDTTDEKVFTLCERALEHKPAAVCVWPQFVPLSKRVLAGSEVRVATVVNFPSGDDAPDDVAALTAKAVADGADEIDVVLPYRAFVDDYLSRAAQVLDETVVAADAAAVKVIIESGELEFSPIIRSATAFAIQHGAQFVKTSTGKTPVSATPKAARVILQEIADEGAQDFVGFKASGGVRTVDDARTYIELAEEIMGAGWVDPEHFRFGASGLLGDILRVLGGGDSGASGDSY